MSAPEAIAYAVNAIGKSNQNITPCRILLKTVNADGTRNEAYIVTRSGKTVWKTQGHARAALRLDLKQIFQGEVRWGRLSHRDAETAEQEFIGNHVEFVPCS